MLVTVSLVDVARGTEPGHSHGLAALYLGFTAAFGPALIRWVDARAAYHYGRRPAAASAASRHCDGRPRVADGVRAVLAAAIAGAVLLTIATVAGTGMPALSEWPR